MGLKPPTRYITPIVISVELQPYTFITQFCGPTFADVDDRFATPRRCMPSMEIRPNLVVYNTFVGNSSEWQVDVFFFFSQEVCVMGKNMFFSNGDVSANGMTKVALKVPNPQGPFEVEYGRGELPSWFTLLIETCDTTSKLTSLNVKHLIFFSFWTFQMNWTFQVVEHEISSMFTFYRKLMGAMLIDVNHIVVVYGTISPISLPKIPEFCTNILVLFFSPSKRNPLTVGISLWGWRPPGAQ